MSVRWNTLDGDTAQDLYRTAATPGALYGVTTARKRRRCDGHLNPERHFIEPGEQYMASALPPGNSDICNDGWLHAHFCMDCAPDRVIAT